MIGGTGYVGLTTGTCLADLGNEVFCIGVHEKKIENLKKGILPIYEPGLKELVDKNVKAGRLAFSTDSKKAIQEYEVIFIAVGTPQSEDGSADLSAIKEVAANIGKYMNGYKVVVNKSTVPVGTGELVRKVIKENQKKSIEFDVVSNPEFLREGSAVYDFLNPDRVVVGVESDKAKKIMAKIYSGITSKERPLVFTNVRTSELIKYASNSMLATRISFMNELSRMCDKAGADINEVALGMGLDKRIGPSFLQAGAGFGGSCFPKDVNALIKSMEEFGVSSKILTSVMDVNASQRMVVVDKVKQLVPNLKGKTVGVWGLSFKPNTDDMRDAPSLTVIEALNNLGAGIKAFDPIAEANAKLIMPDVTYCPTPFEALKGCDCLVLMTDWTEFKDLDKKKIKSLLKAPNIVDARNMFDPKVMKELGFNYLSIGRS